MTRKKTRSKLESFRREAARDRQSNPTAWCLAQIAARINKFENRESIKTHKLFALHNSANKTAYLAIQETSR